ncbi:MAG TPA: 4'-phosphopantetheinyl transferase superfamily protein [Puia sp.]|nr:4'-phosphopantetheinyl transferase superfamily protein [Puia sp.]
MSAGNDIVALAATDSDRTCRYRFFSRIITQHEKQQYFGFPESAGLSFYQYVWLLWSIKESVYKYRSRANPRLPFAPLKIGVRQLNACSPGNLIAGLATHEDAVLYSRSWLNSEFIATVVSNDRRFQGTRHGVQRIGSPDAASQSAIVRELALTSLARHYPGAALRIEKTPGGPPIVWDGDRPLDLPLSLAHHGHYIAFAYRLPSAGIPPPASPNSSAAIKSAAN